MRLFPIFLCTFLASPALSQTSDGSATGGAKDFYSDEACEVYAELEDYMASRSTEELRAIGEQLEAESDSLDAEKMESITGLSEKTSVFLYASDEDQAMTTMFIGGAFLKASHPVLMEEYVAGQNEANGTPADSEEAATANAFFEMVMDGAMEEYKEGCPAD